MENSILIISDLDGTLLNSLGELNLYTISIINRLISKGFLFSVATARALESARPLIAPLNIDLPIILHNGVSIYDLNKEKYLKHLFIPSNLISNFMDMFELHNLNPFLYGVNPKNENKVYYTRISNHAEKYYVEDRLSRHDPRFQKVISLPWTDTKIHEINVLGSKSEILPIAKELMNNNEVGIHFSEDIYTPGFFRLEITHPSANKKNAILYLKDLLKVDKLICFGDADNDISMFEIADEKYAVENAVSSLKRISTKTIKSNKDDGVARFLAEKFLN
jgi:hypothetical protein